MAIALKLGTREQEYNIYGGSAGFLKIIEATGLIGTDLLTTSKILEVFSDLDRRKAIVSILLDEGEFVPEPDFADGKRDAFVVKVAKQLDTGWIIKLIVVLVTELNDATGELSSITPAIATQPQITSDELQYFETNPYFSVEKTAIAPQPDSIQEPQTEMPLEAIAEPNITEGE